MKTTLIASFALCTCAFMQSCLTFQAIKGDGNLVTNDIDITDYERIEMSGGTIDISYEQSEAAPTFTVETDQNIFEKYDFKVEGSTLKIKPKEEFKRANFRPTSFIVKTNSTMLSKVDAAGSTNFDLNSKLVTEKLEIDLAGSGIINLNDSVLLNNLDVALAGSATFNAFKLKGEKFEGDVAGSGEINLGGTFEEVSFDMAGSGTVKAFDLTVERLNSSIAGSGDIEITVNESIKTSVAGSGHIRYKGNPTSISKDIAGSGSVKKVD